MKKQSITFLLTIFMSMIGIQSFAHDISVANADGVTIYYTYVNKSYSTELAVSYEGSSYGNYSNEYSGNVVIPESVIYNGKTYSVTKIVDYAFRDCSGLTSVTIPNSVTNVGSSVFYGTGIYNNASDGVFYVDKWVCGYKGKQPSGSLTLEEGSRGISSEAFSYCSDLTSVTIPNSVTSIGRSAFFGTGIYYNASDGIFYVDKWVCGYKGNKPSGSLVIKEGSRGISYYAFNSCSGLTSVTIPNSVTSIGECAFQSCSGLTSVTIPNSVTSISNYAFQYCSGLTSVTIPNSVTSIGERAFQSCSGLMSVTIPNSVTSIGNEAFSGCSGLTSVTIPNSVTSIGGYAFWGCSGLKSVTIPNSVTSISNYAFAGCSGLTSVTIPNSVTSIGERAFQSCSGLMSVTIPNSVTSIGNEAFFGCSLTSVTIPNSVTSIGNSAFQNCSSLESVTIGTGVLSIGNSIFSGHHPAKVIWLTNTPPSGYSSAGGTVNYVANDQYSFSNKTVYKFLSSTFEVNGVKYVPLSPSERTCDAIDCTYEPAAEKINICETVEYKGVKMKVNQVHPYACYNNQHIKDVKVNCPSDLGQYSFCRCKNIQTALLGEQVTGVGQSAFSDCSKLQGIVIPNAVTQLGDYAFQNCSVLSSAKIGTRVATIGIYAFQNCSSLPLIEIPQSVTKIDNYVFRGCSALKDVYIADRTTELSLGSNSSSPLFADCPLDSVYIGGNISYNKTKNYGYSPFYRNTSLRAVHITDQETEISENEFYGCTGLKNVKIGDGVTTIGNRAFSGCSSLDYFQFGASVETIGQEAFSDCVAVTKVISRAPTPPTCGSQALDDLSKWECQLEVPKGMAAAYQEADQWKDFFFMEEGDAAVTWHKLIYEVDGETFKTVNVAAGAAITPEQAPAKAGFTFASWTGLPTTMPAHDVTVTARYVLAGSDDMSTRGDLNNDGFVNMADVTKLIDYILGRTQ